MDASLIFQYAVNDLKVIREAVRAYKRFNNVLDFQGMSRCLFTVKQRFDHMKLEIEMQMRMIQMYNRGSWNTYNEYALRLERDYNVCLQSLKDTNAGFIAGWATAFLQRS